MNEILSKKLYSHLLKNPNQAGYIVENVLSRAMRDTYEKKVIFSNDPVGLSVLVENALGGVENLYGFTLQISEDDPFLFVSDSDRAVISGGFADYFNGLDIRQIARDFLTVLSENDSDDCHDIIMEVIESEEDFPIYSEVLALLKAESDRNSGVFRWLRYGFNSLLNEEGITPVIDYIEWIAPGVLKDSLNLVKNTPENMAECVRIELVKKGIVNPNMTDIFGYLYDTAGASCGVNPYDEYISINPDGSTVTTVSNETIEETISPEQLTDLSYGLLLDRDTLYELCDNLSGGDFLGIAEDVMNEIFNAIHHHISKLDDRYFD